MLVGMVIAGPVFTEWYWGPIFFLLLFSPVLAGLTTALYLAARRRVRRRARPLLLAGCFALSVLLVLAGASAWRSVQFERQAQADAERIDFATFLPRGYDAERLRPVVADHVRALWATYDGPLYVEEERAGPVDASDPAACRIMIAGPLATHPGALGPCRRATTRGGGQVLLTEDGREAAVYAVRDGTLVKVRHPRGAAEDALALVDALEPVAPRDLDFKR
jgi:hypothetical protein